MNLAINLKHFHLIYFLFLSVDKCIKGSLEIEDLNYNEDSRNQTAIELCYEPHRHGYDTRPTCGGKLTFINEYEWKKL